MIFERENYKRQVFYCDSNEVNYNNLLPEFYKKDIKKIDKFLSFYQTKKLSEVADVLLGISVPTVENTEEGIPYLSAASIQNGVIIPSKKRIIDKDLKKLLNILFEKEIYS